ncbi:hypothetical protein EON65_51170 [archaeon]|nr:MAG: hypothetical protein EON65_51170 [archaeon]
MKKKKEEEKEGDEEDNFKIAPVQKSYLLFNALEFDILCEEDCVILQLRDRNVLNELLVTSFVESQLLTATEEPDRSLPAIA